MNDSNKFDKRINGLPSEEMAWLKYYDRKFDEKDIPNESIYQFALKSNQNNMDSVALDVRVSNDSFNRGYKLTYGNLFKRISDSSKSSFKLGIKKDDIVPIILPNIPDARVVIYSNSILGSVSYPISPLIAVNQLDRIISENETKNVFISSDQYFKYEKAMNNSNIENIILFDSNTYLPDDIDSLKELRSKINNMNKSIMKCNSKIISWDEYVKTCSGVSDIKPFYEDNHTTAIIGTSGTTGTSKGVCLTDRNLNAAACAYKNGKLFEGVMLDALLPSIAYGLSMLHFETVDGKKTYLIPELLMDKFPLASQKLRPDAFAGGPVHYKNILKSDYFKNGTLYKGKIYLSGGASLDPEDEHQLNGVSKGYKENGIINDNLFVRQGYGQSEGTAVCAISKRGAYSFGSVGIPVPYARVGIFKPGTDIELPYNTEGEICMTSPTVMKEYLNNKKETDHVLKVHSDGKTWVHSEDLGYMDEDGNLYHSTRIKEIFMRTGFNVHPKKISEFINTIPGVENSIVMGFEHPREQTVPIAFVELSKSITDGEYENIRKFIIKECFENLEATSVPYDIVLVDKVPINAGGKKDSVRIREEAKIDLMSNEKVLIKTLIFNK